MRQTYFDNLLFNVVFGMRVIARYYHNFSFAVPCEHSHNRRTVLLV